MLGGSEAEWSGGAARWARWRKPGPLGAEPLKAGMSWIVEVFKTSGECSFFVGVTLLGKTTQVPSVQVCDTSSVYGIVCPPPTVTSSVTIFTALPTPALGNHHTVIWVYEFLFVLLLLLVFNATYE